MNCTEFKKHLAEYFINDDMDPNVKRGMEEHYFECDSCFEQLKMISALMGTIKKEGVEKLLAYSSNDTLQSIANTSKHLINKLKESFTNIAFPVHTCSYYAVRGDITNENKYVIGEKIIISIKAPKDKGGHLVLIHFDEKENLKLILPRDTSMEKKLKPNEEIRIGLNASEPIGNHYLKAFITTRKMFQIDYDKIDNSLSLISSLNDFYESISTSDLDELMESISIYEVIET